MLETPEKDESSVFEKETRGGMTEMPLSVGGVGGGVGALNNKKDCLNAANAPFPSAEINQRRLNKPSELLMEASRASREFSFLLSLDPKEFNKQVANVITQNDQEIFDSLFEAAESQLETIVQTMDHSRSLHHGSVPPAMRFFR
jgi:hypothetical protein